MLAGDVAAGVGNARAGVFNEGADYQIRANVGGFKLIHKFAVAVVTDADGGGVCFANYGKNLSDYVDGKAGAGGIAAAALNVGHFCAANRRGNGVKIHAAVRQHGQLFINYAEFLQRADALAVDNALQGVIGRSGKGNHNISGAQNAEKRGGNCVGAAHKIVANH